MYWSLQLKIASHDTGGGTPSVVGKIDDSLPLLALRGFEDACNITSAASHT
jgi:hypothetical protein